MDDGTTMLFEHSMETTMPRILHNHTSSLLITTMITIASAFVSGCGKPVNSYVSYEYVYSGAYTGNGTANALGTTISFVVRWNETDGEITGEYQDNYFAENAAPVRGSVLDGMRQFTVELYQRRSGATKIRFATEALVDKPSEVLMLPNMAAFNESGETVIAQTKVMTIAGGGFIAPEGEAANFFASIAGIHEFFAKVIDPAHDKTDWVHGKSYAITVQASGFVSLDSEKGLRHYAYGVHGGTYERKEVEEFISLSTPTGIALLIQRQFNASRLLFLWQNSNGVSWSFQKEPPGPL